MTPAEVEPFDFVGRQEGQYFFEQADEFLLERITRIQAG
jgi:hypothetical protein